MSDDFPPLWIIEDRKPRRANIHEWSAYMTSADRHVRLTEVHTPGASTAQISTVFLGIDHAFGLDERPVLFETMVFGGQFNECQWRYSTWDEAEEGHAQVVALMTTRAKASAGQ